MAGWRDKAEKVGGMRDCKTLFWTLRLDNLVKCSTFVKMILS